ncbi:hypothetical protein [Rhodopila sp.]|uniref:hypothetical protein n=1 Tax=Rhodopila sp. TaxID=2480087 RepID=UPI003D0D6BE1
MPNSAPPADSEPQADMKTWMAVSAAMIGAFIAVLNIQITNASLPNIQGAIGAGIDDGGWISHRLSGRRDRRHPAHPASSPRYSRSGAICSPTPSCSW